jgi:hypothetical protein
MTGEAPSSRSLKRSFWDWIWVWPGAEKRLQAMTPRANALKRIFDHRLDMVPSFRAL